ncbi:MAG: arylsulfatase [Candidatus Glassbacteria bacterium]|nr:arylsulfatase [Candidatus Glassbacteria bacterium]
MPDHKLNRRTFFRAGAALALGAPLVSSCAGGDVPLNVVLVLTDDQGWGDVPRNGNLYLETPVLDSFAASGASLERFHVSPVCAPTRAALLTGRYPWRSGVHGVTRGRETMSLDEVTVADLFKRQGYATGCFGKWHNGAHYPYHPLGRGFDHFLGFCAGHWNNYFDTTLDSDGEMVETEGYIADVLTDGAISFIEQNARRPFFLYLPYNTPHSPFQVPDQFYDKYFRLTGDPTLACVYGMVENLDRNFGRVLNALDDNGVRSRTVVVFITDNGPQTDRFNNGLRERKGSVFDGGTRVPCYIQWPDKIAPGTRVERVAAHVDLLPTLCEIAGIGTAGTRPLDGTSLVPLLTGTARDWPDRMMFTGWRGNGAVHTDRWNLVVRGGNPPELYDVLADPGQRHDLSASLPAVSSALFGAFGKWRTEARSGGLTVPPIPIGYRGWTAVLPGHEAELSGGLTYNGRAGWANDWVQNFSPAGGEATWNIEVITAGKYEFAVDYVCPPEDLGAVIRIEAAGAGLAAAIEQPHDPPYIPSPDRVKRIEVYEKEWAALPLGVMNLPAGATTLRLSAPEVPGPGGIQIKAVRIRRAN